MATDKLRDWLIYHPMAKWRINHFSSSTDFPPLHNAAHNEFLMAMPIAAAVQQHAVILTQILFICHQYYDMI
jgi:hypothetical protein